MNSNKNIFPTANPSRRFSNVLGTCFFNKACIARRNADEAQANQSVAEQQMVISQLLNKPSGMSAGTIGLIVFGIVALTGGAILLIKKRKI